MSVLGNTLSAWRHRLAYLRFRPFPTETEEGRAAERIRRVALTAAASLLGKSASAVTTLLSVPLTIVYLGPERYGLWLTVSSTIAMLTFADLGIGNGLVTKLAEADGRNDLATMKKLTSSAFAILSAISALLSVALVVACPHIDWSRLLSLKSSVARTEVPTAVLTLGLLTFVTMPVSVVAKVQSGLQEGVQVALWAMGGTVLSVGALVLVTHMQVGLVGLILAVSGTPVLVTIVNFLWCFTVSHRHLRPSLRSANFSTALSLLRIGLLFVMLQIGVAFAFLSDNFVVANRLGSAAVAGLAVPAKLFSLMLLPVTLIVGPLWPAYGEARARGDISWMRRIYKRLTLGSVGLALVSGILLVFLGSLIVRIWSRGVVDSTYAVLIPLAIWTCLTSWGQSAAALLNGTGQITGQAICAVVLAGTAFYLKWILVDTSGLPGVVWASVISYLIVVVVPVSVLVHRELRVQ